MFCPKDLMCQIRAQNTLIKAELLHSLLMAIGKNVSIATRLFINTYCHKEYLYQVWTQNIFSCFCCTVLCFHGYNGYHSNQANPHHILFQGTYVPNINSHKAELLQSLLIVIVIVFPWQQRSSINTYCYKELCFNYELEILSCCWVFAQFLCCHVYSGHQSKQVSIDIFYPKENMCLIWT